MNDILDHCGIKKKRTAPNKIVYASPLRGSGYEKPSRAAPFVGFHFRRQSYSLLRRMNSFELRCFMP